MINTNYFKRIVDECFYEGNPMHHDTFNELVKRDDKNKKNFMKVLVKYKRIEHKFHIKVVDASFKSMDACIVKDIYRNDKLVATVTIDWSDIDSEWTDEEDTAANEIKVADMLEAALEGHLDEDFKRAS